MGRKKGCDPHMGWSKDKRKDKLHEVKVNNLWRQEVRPKSDRKNKTPKGYSVCLRIGREGQRARRHVDLTL